MVFQPEKIIKGLEALALELCAIVCWQVGANPNGTIY